VGDPVFDQLSEAVEQLDEALDCLFLVESALLYHLLAEGARLGQLEDDVEIVQGFMDVVEVDDVGTF
jgi:hypothetical protein